jgi:hypothetical protein
VGQLSGYLETGIWNEMEMWPMMLSKVKATRCLPNLEGETLKIVNVSSQESVLIKEVRTHRSGETKTSLFQYPQGA